MKNWPAIVTVLALLLMTALGMAIIADWRLDGDFPAIRPKSSEMQVKQMMGEPGEVDRPCRAFGVQLIANCDHVFVYRSTLAPLRGKHWLVFFDQNNQATATSTETKP
ncbi:hypothetical protein [Edaphobacter aggregans]|uniref:hypothetical protein n=1 Tax=Edaphobacter aggregans TaxID=570835 RepID=UPI0005504BBE|nr:hypothetical protein [Edaphobacter aggregans]